MMYNEGVGIAIEGWGLGEYEGSGYCLEGDGIA